jgi:ABC-type multidrug transport system ATPase subunit
MSNTVGNLVEVRGLCKRYDSFMLDNVIFDVPNGYIMGFIGPNGAGKTTIIKLILDEPTNGLDPVARDEICDLLRDFVSDESKSVLFSTHITSDLEKVADYITFILDGTIVFTGYPFALGEKSGMDILYVTLSLSKKPS